MERVVDALLHDEDEDGYPDFAPFAHHADRTREYYLKASAREVRYHKARADEGSAIVNERHTTIEGVTFETWSIISRRNRNIFAPTQAIMAIVVSSKYDYRTTMSVLANRTPRTFELIQRGDRADDNTVIYKSNGLTSVNAFDTFKIILCCDSTGENELPFNTMKRVL